MFRFTLPRDLYFGENAIQHLKELRGKKRAFIVTGGHSMQSNGFIAKIEGVLNETEIAHCLFEGVEPDPSIETVMRGAKQMQEFNPDVIIAVGGGSPIDAAKAMWVFYEYPEARFEDILKPFSFPKLRNKAIFVAIPSTSGTASEVTSFSVITDYSTKVKYPLADFEITPDIAILDTLIPRSMPKSLVAVTGMDALTHAIEGYVSKVANPLTDALSLSAIEMIAANLIKAYQADKEAMSAMHLAQCMAGMSFSNALLGITHSLAHKTGAAFGISHGKCNAILLAPVIEYNRRACENKYAKVAEAMGISGGCDKIKVNKLIELIREMNKALDIPNSYLEAGAEEKTFLTDGRRIAEYALSDPCTSSNPRPIDEEGMYGVLREAFYYPRCCQKEK